MKDVKVWDFECLESCRTEFVLDTPKCRTGMLLNSTSILSELRILLLRQTSELPYAGGWSWKKRDTQRNSVRMVLFLVFWLEMLLAEFL